MNIKRQQEVVEGFHYDVRTEEMGKLETGLRVGLHPIDSTDENYPKENTILNVRLEFTLVFDEYVLSGIVNQVNHLINRVVREQTDLTQEEVDELVNPLFNIVQRLSYEVTEIALDKPGIKLNFKAS